MLPNACDAILKYKIKCLQYQSNPIDRITIETRVFAETGSVCRTDWRLVISVQPNFPYASHRRGSPGPERSVHLPIKPAPRRTVTNVPSNPVNDRCVVQLLIWSGASDDLPLGRAFEAGRFSGTHGHKPLALRQRWASSAQPNNIASRLRLYDPKRGRLYSE